MTQYLIKKSVQTGKGEIFYFADMSFKDRPVVVLLHGLSSNHTTWLRIIDDLHKHKYNSIALDLRGHGLSDKTKNKKFYALNIFSDDLDTVIKNEKINKFILVGYSFGGQIAIDYASRYSEHLEGLVLISANYVNPLEYKWHLNFLTPVAYGFLNFLAFLVLWQERKEYHYYQHGKMAGYWRSVYNGLRTMPISINLWMLSGILKLELKEAARKIKVPTYVVYGKYDAFITKAEINDMAKAIPHAEIIISKNQDHFVGTNSQDETSEIVLNFLNTQEGNTHP